jgi:hypothetical protein
VLYSRSFVKTGNTNLTLWKKAVYSKEYKIVLGSYIAYYFTLQGRNSYKFASFIDLEGFFLPYREEPAAAVCSGDSDSITRTRILLL